MKDLSLYSSINAKIRVWISKLLTPEHWKLLYDSKDTQSLMTKLENTRFSEWIRNSTPENFAEYLDTAILKESLAIEKNIAKKLSGVPSELISILTEEYDIEQIKRGLRVWRTKTDFTPPDTSLVSQRHKIEWSVFSPKNSIEEIILTLMNTPYGEPLSSQRLLFRKTGSLFYFEHALEKDLFARISREIDKLSMKDKKAARKMLGIQTDIFNINNILRCKLFFKIPANEINDIIYANGTYFSPAKCFEAYIAKDASEFLNKISVPKMDIFAKKIKQLKMIDVAPFLNEIMSLLLYKEIQNCLRGYPFTLGIPLAYILLNRFETQQLRSLAWAVKLGKNQQIELFKNTNPLAHK